jgi:hypothetical protein
MGNVDLGRLLGLAVENIAIALIDLQSAKFLNERNGLLTAVTNSDLRNNPDAGEEL